MDGLTGLHLERLLRLILALKALLTKRCLHKGAAPHGPQSESSLGLSLAVTIPSSSESSGSKLRQTLTANLQKHSQQAQPSPDRLPPSKQPCPNPGLLNATHAVNDSLKYRHLLSHSTVLADQLPHPDDG